MVSPASPLVETALLCLLMIYFYTRLSVALRTLALQKDVDLLTSWINEHNLTLNVRKCKSLYISRKASYFSGQTIEISGQALEKVQSYKYLGVIINSNLTWSDHVSRVCSKARK